LAIFVSALKFDFSPNNNQVIPTCVTVENSGTTSLKRHIALPGLIQPPFQRVRKEVDTSRLNNTEHEPPNIEQQLLNGNNRHPEQKSGYGRLKDLLTGPRVAIFTFTQRKRTSDFWSTHARRSTLYRTQSLSIVIVPAKQWIMGFLRTFPSFRAHSCAAACSSPELIATPSQPQEYPVCRHAVFRLFDTPSGILFKLPHGTAPSWLPVNVPHEGLLPCSVDRIEGFRRSSVQ
jgi:hypothetical protein